MAQLAKDRVEGTGRVKKVAALAALMGASLVVALLLAEAALRIVDFSHPSLFDLDRVRGNALHPGAEGWRKGEGAAYVRINSRGLRDREHDLAKPPGTFRIAVLGDSYSEAFQVPREQAFWSVLERELSACPAFAGRTVEAINFGISGHGTNQEYLTLKHYGWQYQPDLVLLAFYTGNDVRNNSRALEGSPYRPYFVYEGDRLVLDNSFRELPDFAPDRIEWIHRRNDIINASRVVQLLWSSYTRLRDWRAAARVKQVKEGEEAGLNYDVYRPPGDAIWTEAWRVTEGVMRMTHRDAQSHGAELWLAVLTSGIQVHTDAALRRTVMNRLGVDDLLYPDRRLRRFAEREGIPSIILVEPFMKKVAADGVLLHGFDGKGMGHWNAIGHRLGGEIMARRICESRRRGR